MTRLSLDELEVPTLLPPRSTSSLANFSPTTLDLEIDSVSKKIVDPSGVRLVHYEGSHDVKRTGKASAPIYPSSSSTPTVLSTLISHSVDNLGWMEYSPSTDPSCLNMLHLHPFAQASTHSVDSGCSSSSHWAKHPSSDASSHNISNPPRPPSSASFMDMGKSNHAKRSYSYQIQSSGRRWGRSVSDGIPLIKYHARKGGSRFWRTLVRPSLLSFLDNPKPPDTHSVPSISAELGGLDASLILPSKELLPRPAPYFYPRRVDCEQDELSCESTTHDSFFCNLGELPIDSFSNTSKHKSKCIPMSLNTGELQGLPGGDGEDGTSINTDEIETWKKQQTDLASKARRSLSSEHPVPFSSVLTSHGQKSRLSLRQRFGSSLKQSISFHQLRSARSELDVSQFAHQQDGSETMGPGITDDPFASLLTSPQLLPAQVAFFPATSLLTLSPTASSPLQCSSEPALDPTLLSLETRRRSFMNMDPDCDDPSASSSVSHSDISHQRRTPCPLSNLGCSSVLGRSTQPGEKVTSTSAPQSRLGRVSKDSGILCQTPLLTPDLDSIETSSPSLSDGLCDIQVRCINDDQDPSKSIVPFPSLDSSQERPMVPDIFEESAVEEGTSQDQIFYSCALDLPHISSVSLDSGGNKIPRLRRKLSLRGVDGECIADGSIGSIDMSESIADFTLLAVEWPLPPSHTSPESGIPHGDETDFEVKPLAENRPLRPHGGDHPFTSSAGAKPSLDKRRTTSFSKPLALGIPQRPSSITLSSPIDFVRVTLGSSILKHTDLPNVIVLAPAIETRWSGTSISFRAASRLVLISFLAYHGETRLEAQRVSGGRTSILACVTLCNAADHNQLNPDTATVTLMNKGSQLKPTQDGSISFSLDLPIPLGELAVAVAKVSFRNGLSQMANEEDN